MARFVVAAIDRIPPGERLIATIAGRSIGIFNVGGTFYAIRNRCPHQGAELCRGRTVPAPAHASLPGEFPSGAGAPFLQCPWHGWEFDLKSGRSWFDPCRVRVASYPVEIERAPAPSCLPAPPGGSERGTVQGVRAETYQVTVESDHVVVSVGR